MASIYTAFLNNGNMLLPNIEYKENAEAQEIKDSKEDENGTELGWFNSFCEDKNLLIISMVEDVKDRGGSHYLLPKIKAIYQ